VAWQRERGVCRPAVRVLRPLGAGERAGSVAEGSAGWRCGCRVVWCGKAGGSGGGAGNGTPYLCGVINR